MGISLTALCNGVEEFFPDGVYEGKNLVELHPKYGREWHMSDLRNKSNTDLHKLWFVLLKERNIILTMRAECKRVKIPCPGAERHMMVIRSMKRLKDVINERHNAILELEKNRWYKFDEALEEAKEAPYVRKDLKIIEEAKNTNDQEDTNDIEVVAGVKT